MANLVDKTLDSRNCYAKSKSPTPNRMRHISLWIVFILLTQRTCIKLKVFGTFGSNAIPVPGTYRMNIGKCFFVFIKMNRFFRWTISFVHIISTTIDAHVCSLTGKWNVKRRLPECIGRHWWVGNYLAAPFRQPFGVEYFADWFEHCCSRSVRFSQYFVDVLDFVLGPLHLLHSVVAVRPQWLHAVPARPLPGQMKHHCDWMS